MDGVEECLSDIWMSPTAKEALYQAILLQWMQWMQWMHEGIPSLPPSMLGIQSVTYVNGIMHFKIRFFRAVSPNESRKKGYRSRR
jgi:hypothetical protein